MRGGAFGGMGSSREMAHLRSSRAGASFGPVQLGGAGGRKQPDPDGIAGSRTRSRRAASLLAFAALYVVLIAETGRIPVDNPDTHLELTMVHEGMILEASGPDLALYHWERP